MINAPAPSSASRPKSAHTKSYLVQVSSLPGNPKAKEVIQEENYGYAANQPTMNLLHSRSSLSKISQANLKQVSFREGSAGTNSALEVRELIDSCNEY